MLWGKGVRRPFTGPAMLLTGDTSNKLQEVRLPLIPWQLCQLLYGQTDILPDMLCAGNFRNMKTACEVRPTVGMEAKPRDFRCYICFKPGALLLGGSVVPNSLVPMGLRSTSPYSHGLSGRPQGGLCANATQASVRPCEPRCWPEQPRAPHFPRGHADCHSTAPTLYLQDSVVNTACLQQGLPIDKVGLHEWRDPGSIP